VAVTEYDRHQLFNRLKSVLGEAEAPVLREPLPPVGWGDVATKRDLELFELKIDAKLERELRMQSQRFIVCMAALMTLFLTAQTYLLGYVIR